MDEEYLKTCDFTEMLDAISELTETDNPILDQVLNDLLDERIRRKHAYPRND